jgi:hypothetical protein
MDSGSKYRGLLGLVTQSAKERSKSLSLPLSTPIHPPQLNHLLLCLPRAPLQFGRPRLRRLLAALHETQLGPQVGQVPAQEQEEKKTKKRDRVRAKETEV